MRRHIAHLRSLSLFLLLPAVSAVTPLLVLPAITSQYGEQGLASYGISLSVGSAASLLAELGWGIVGPQQIASGTEASRSRLYQMAAATKIATYPFFGVAAAAAAFVLSRDHQLEAALMAFGFGLGCFSSNWFFIGLNRPLMILAIEGVPRLLLFLGAALAIGAGAPFVLFGIATVIAPVFSYIVSSVVLKERLLPRPDSFKQGFLTAKAHLPLTVGRGISSLYTALPTTLVAIAAPQSVALFTAIERLMRMAASILVGFHNRMQSWVASGPADEHLKRIRQQIRLSGLLAVVSALGFFALAPTVASLVFSGTVAVPYSLSALAALVLVCLVMTRAYGLSLVALQRPNAIALANLAAAAVGTSMILVLAGHYGSHGGVLGEIAAEAAGVLVQLCVVMLVIRRLERRPEGDTT